MVIYLDVVMLANFLLDYLSLKILLGILGTDTPLWRVSMASFFGALYACGSIFLETYGCSSYITCILSVCVASLLCKMVISIKGIKQLLISTITYLLCCMSLSGIADFIYDHTYFGYGIARNEVVFRGVLMVLTMMITKKGVKSYKQAKKGKRLQNIKICHGEKTKRITALMDTGNCLKTREGKPVYVIEFEIIKSFLPKLYDAICKTMDPLYEVEDENLVFLYLKQFHFSYLPYRTAGFEGVFMTVTFEEMIRMHAFGETTEENVTFALSMQPLTLCAPFYQAIVTL